MKSSYLCYAQILTVIAVLKSSLIPTTHCSQILGLFAHPGKSHFDFFRPLFLGLAESGHNVTMVSYFPNKEPVGNYTDYELTGMPIIASNVDLKVFSNSKQLIPFKVPTFFMLHGWGMEACETAFKHKIIKQLLTPPIPKFDVIILEQFNNDCMMAVAHQLQAPIIAASSCAIMPWHYRRMGSPFVMSFMPTNFLPHTDQMDFGQRINNFVHFHILNFLYDYYTIGATNALIQKHFGSSVPSVEELVKKTSLMLINQHYSLTGVMPYAPNIIEVGGLQIQDAKPLPLSFQALLDNASQGVVYISWGSMIRPETLPDVKRAALLNSIARFPSQLFLMKWPNDTLPNKPKNLRTYSWMPQRDILCHPNVKVFMSHGGLLGTSEAAYCGVPMLVTPIYGDQFLNSAWIEQRKLGLIVHFQDLVEHKIVEALGKILQPNFTKQAKMLSEAYKSRPEKPLDLAIWWVEYVIQNKGAPLAQSASTNLNWFVHNSFDIYLFFATLIVITLLFIRLFVKIAVRLCTKKTQPIKAKVN